MRLAEGCHAVKRKSAFAPGERGAPQTALTICALVLAVYFANAVWRAVDFAARFADQVAFVICLIAIAGIAIASQYHMRRGITLIIGASFLAQLFWAAWADPQPIDDLARMWDAARRLSVGLASANIESGLLAESHAPSALVFYALVMTGLGDDVSSMRVVSALCWCAQIYLVWRIALLIPILRERATLAAGLFGLAPSLVVYGALPSIEAVFGTFALIGVYYFLKSRESAAIQDAFFAGLFFALAYLARPIGGAYCISAAAVLVAVAHAANAERRKYMRMQAAVLLLGFAVGVAPLASFHALRSGAFSIAPGAALGYQFLIGANIAGGGGFSETANGEDLRQVGIFGDNTVSPIAANRLAIQRAFERLAQNPFGFAGMAATEKIRRLWSNERELLTWGLNTASHAAANAVSSRIKSTLAARHFVDGFYLAFILLTFLAFARLALTRGRFVTEPHSLIYILGLALGLVFAMVFLEARPRQHLPLTPLMALCGSFALAQINLIRIPLPKFLLKRRHSKNAHDAQATRETKAESIHTQPPAAKLAHVLSRMSKPSRPDDDQNQERKNQERDRSA